MTRWRMTLTEPTLANMDILEELSRKGSSSSLF